MKPRGFSLVEVLVVLVILGLTVTFTTLGFQRLEDDRLTKQAGHLSVWLQDISDNAVLDGAVYGAWLVGDPIRLEAAYYYDNRWWWMSGEDIGAEVLDDSLTLFQDSGKGWKAVQPQKRDVEQLEPNILFMPSGLTIPEKLQLRAADRRMAEIERDENGIYTWSIPQ